MNPDDLLSDWEHEIDRILSEGSFSDSPLPPVLIVPHIDFRVNLELYTRTYARLAAAAKFPETVVILGVGHQCPHEFSIHPFGFETVLGKIYPDLDSWGVLSNVCDFSLSNDPQTFFGEHSIEFVAIWLETVRQLYAADQPLKILPVLCGGLFEHLHSGRIPSEQDEVYRLGKALRTLYDQQLKGSTLIIVSIDGCHVGPRFQHSFTGNRATQRSVRRWEADLWKQCHHHCYPAFFQHLASLTNCFYFDGVGALSMILQHFPFQSHIEKTELWYEQSDQSFVTFSAGWMA